MMVQSARGLHSGVQDNPPHLNVLPSTETILQHWAPQLRPNTLSSSQTTVPAADHAVPTQLSPTGMRVVPTAGSDSCAERSRSRSRSRSRRKESRFFPLSAFLACPDPTGRYPSKSKFSSSLTTGPPLPAELVDREHEGASEALPTVVSVAATRNCLSPSREHGQSAPALPNCDWNFSLDIPATQTPIRRLPRSMTQSHLSNHHAGRAFTALVTAPIGSPRPFINMPPLRIRPAVPLHLFNAKILSAIPSEQTLKLHPVRYEVQQDHRSFLDLGHANPCWCSIPIDAMAHECATMEQLPMPPASTETDHSETVNLYIDSALDSTSPPSSLQESRSQSELSTLLSDDWTVLPYTSRSHGRRCRSKSSSETIDDEEGAYLISAASYTASGPPTPMPSPEDGMSESISGSSSLSLCVLSPSGSTMELTRSPWDEGECQVCQRYICVCDGASTSAVEWPILQDNTGVMKRTGHELRGGTLNMDDAESIWELDGGSFL
ncbi:hypothetical protein T440DRAFT_447117 [Plenodomus tracheiphilus IPT5]|uniref:Uncharacterized protein n=1 Tax=Plenodomus tracheiphilus IPT5 TaxID=1408161 RepID=A0A6A7BAG5_9PLEO|nr:hypothetical protein T440DRAFT_447117 [Plenodomus tracheiphilus IPT5]